MNITALTIVRGRESHLRNQWLGWRLSDRKPRRWIIVGMDQDVVIPGQSEGIEVIASRVDGEAGSLPLARARNHAMSLCKTEGAIFLDVDCIPSSRMLALFTQAIQDEDRLWMGSPRYLPAGSTAGRWQMEDLEQQAVVHPLQPDLNEGQRLASTEYEKFWSLCFAIRKDTFDRIGGFCESFAGYGGEDTDFAYAARKTGVPFGFIGAFAYHQHHTVCKPPLNYFEAIIRNAIQFHRRWNVWPMESWLKEFASRGFIEFDASSSKLEIRHHPTQQQIEQTKVETPAGF